MEIIKATTVSQLRVIEKLARKILPEHYQPYITRDHISFFIEKFQTLEAIRGQMKNGFEYYLFRQDGKNAGYLGIQPSGNVMVLSKLYILKQFRGKGIGSKAMSFADQRASELNVSRIELIVNVNNQEAISFYKRKGYEIKKPLTHIFENGYAVEDFKMSKAVRGNDAP